jgi:hypothetical protein
MNHQLFFKEARLHLQPAISMRSYRSGYNQTARMNEGETSSRIGITQYVQCTVQYGVYAVYDIKGMCRITVGTQQELASVCSSQHRAM